MDVEKEKGNRVYVDQLEGNSTILDVAERRRKDRFRSGWEKENRYGH